MHPKRSLVTLLVVVMTLSVSAPVAAAYQPPGGAVFNNPQGGHRAKFRIVRTINRAIKGARRGSRIQISTYLMDSKESTTLLIKARKRGVAVQAVIDGSAKNRQTLRLAKALNRDNRKKVRRKHRRGGPDRSYVVFCRGSCRNGGRPNHTKYFTFTRTGKARNVVMVSSSNLNRGGAVKGYNDLLVMKKQKRLTKDFASVHREMAEDSRNDGDGFIQFNRGHITARFYPTKKKADPVMQDLRQIRCRGTRQGAGRHKRTTIHVSMFRWNSRRGIALARKLVRLDRAGCEVSVIYGAPGRRVRDVLRTSARRGGVRLWDSRWDYNHNGTVDMRVHHKYMLISGRYGKDRSAWRVHTGSQNWGRSLHAGDENTINIAGPKTYRQYLRNWRHVVRHAGRRVGRG